MKNNFFWYLQIIALFWTLIPSAHANQLTNRLKQYAHLYLEPTDRQMPSTALMLNTCFVFNYGLHTIGKRKDIPLFISNLPTINFLIQLAHQIYPLDIFTISINKIAISMSYLAFTNISKFYKEYQPDKQWLWNILNTMVSLGFCTLAKHNNSTLFTTYTYISAFDFFDGYLSAVPWKPLSIPLRYYHVLFHDDIIKHPLIKNIGYVFDAKKNMFFCGMLLGCFNIKIKNNSILTNPLYWLPVGLGHMFFAHYKWSDAGSQGNYEYLYKSLLVEILNALHTPLDENSITYKMLINIVRNTIPILSVLLNTVFYF